MTLIIRDLNAEVVQIGDRERKGENSLKLGENARVKVEKSAGRGSNLDQ